MNFLEIINKIKCSHKIASKIGYEDLDIDEISIDSRKINISKNTIFFALEGKNSSVEKNIQSAINSGAKIIVSRDIVDSDLIISIKTEHVFMLLVEFLKIFYNPLPHNIYAVTGTNGKTSVAEYARQILNLINKKSASIGTLGVTCEEKIQGIDSFSLTTPDIVSLYKNLYTLKKNNINDVAIEVSSIGLDQARVAGLNIEVASFTNFTQDHLDYHKNMEDYFYSKMLLFEAVMKDKSAVVLNADIKEFAKIKRMCESKKHFIFEYGFKALDLKIIEITPKDYGQDFIIQFNGKRYSSSINIFGEFQVCNILCAMGMVMAKNFFNEESFEILLKNLKNIKSAEGRMDKVATLNNGAQIYIDFAHSPDALQNVLVLARKLNPKKLYVLFGCGGDRDSSKRPMMGKVAAELADFVIITDDNPRFENPEIIRKEIIANISTKNYIEISERKEAIFKAIGMLKDNDILIIAGKGHEKYQIIKDQKFEFDEKEIVKDIIKNLN